MDRLFAHVPSAEQLTLVGLVQAEERLQRVRRIRRALVTATALASLACWVAARFPAASVFCPLVFLTFGVAALGSWLVERRAVRLRDGLVDQLPVEYQVRLGGLQ